MILCCQVEYLLFNLQSPQVKKSGAICEVSLHKMWKIKRFPTIFIMTNHLLDYLHIIKLIRSILIPHTICIQNFPLHIINKSNTCYFKLSKRMFYIRLWFNAVWYVKGLKIVSFSPWLFLFKSKKRHLVLQHCNKTLHINLIGNYYWHVSLCHLKISSLVL